MSENRCYQCMRPKQYGDLCEHCGASFLKIKQTEHGLKAGKYVTDRILVGAVLRATSEVIIYVAYDQALMQKIILIEYFPVKLVTRNTYTGYVEVKNETREAFNHAMDLFLQEGIRLTKQSGSLVEESVYEIIKEHHTAYWLMEYNDKNLSYTPPSYIKRKAPNQKGVKKRLVILAAAVSILLIIFLSVVIPRILPQRMPQVVGLSLDTAVEIIQKTNIDYEIIQVFSATDSPDTVIRQEPAASRNIRNLEEPIRLTVNLAVEIPRVEGRTIHSAIDILTQNDLAYEIIPTYNANYAPERVIEQEPAAGNVRATQDIVVKLYEAMPVKMPEMKGVPFFEAKKILDDLHIIFEINYEYDDSDARNQVLSQSPDDERQILNRRDRVQLTVNSASTLPDITGLYWEDAYKTLDRAGFMTTTVRTIQTHEMLPDTFRYRTVQTGQVLDIDDTIDLFHNSVHTIRIIDPILRSAIEHYYDRDDYPLTNKDALRLDMIEFPGEQDRRIQSLEGIQYFKNLTILRLPDHHIEDLSPLSSLHHLIEVDLSSNRITSLRDIAYLGSLKNLYLNFNQIRNLSNIHRLENLQELELSSNLLYDIKGIESLHSLQVVDFSFNQIHAIDQLRELPHLMYINLSNNRIETWPVMAYPESLRIVSIARNEINDLTPMQNLIYLTTLHASYNSIESIESIAHMSDLQYLFLDGNHIADISPLSRAASLYELSIVNNPISDYSPLKALSRLQGLEIDGDGNYDDFHYLETNNKEDFDQ